MFTDIVPKQLARRLLSVRAFDEEGMMMLADVLEGTRLAAVARDWLKRDEIAYVHAHNAKPGCFAARIDRR